MAGAEKPVSVTAAESDEPPVAAMDDPAPAVAPVFEAQAPGVPASAVVSVPVSVAVPVPVPVSSPGRPVMPAAPVPRAAARPSVHSAGTYIVGDIASAGPLHLEGSVQGTVRCQQLSIGRDGVVGGRIDAGQMRLEGLVEGEVACERLEMTSTAKLQGSLVCKVLVLTHGAELQGEISVGWTPP